MLTRKEYLTVLNEGVAELEEKKSRFIATVSPAASEDQAQRFVERLKTRYWNASHNVYAYYLYNGALAQKFSDDGEPSGTAGLPVLDVIKKMNVQDVAVVVTRYFGGTLLGASGLVRAYGKCAAMGIEAAGIVTRQLCREVRIEMDYSLLGKIQALALTKGYKAKDTVYAQDVNMYLYVPVDEFDMFSALVADASGARAVVHAGDNSYVTKES